MNNVTRLKTKFSVLRVRQCGRNNLVQASPNILHYAILVGGQNFQNSGTNPTNFSKPKGHVQEIRSIGKVPLPLRYKK